MGRARKELKSRTETKFSRVVQVHISGKCFKRFEAERIHEEETESGIGRILIIEALTAREEKRNAKTKNPFFS